MSESCSDNAIHCVLYNLITSPRASWRQSSFHSPFPFYAYICKNRACICRAAAAGVAVPAHFFCGPCPPGQGSAGAEAHSPRVGVILYAVIVFQEGQQRTCCERLITTGLWRHLCCCSWASLRTPPTAAGGVLRHCTDLWRECTGEVVFPHAPHAARRWHLRGVQNQLTSMQAVRPVLWGLVEGSGASFVSLLQQRRGSAIP